LLEEALQLAGRGWPIFRLSAHKVPFKGSHGHLDATTDAGQITRWWTEKPAANIGMACGRIVVIDPDGPTALARLAAIGAPHGGWPRTLTAKTPRGIHLYYWAPDDVEIRSYNEPRAKKGDDGIDIKGLGGYCLVPPSKTKGGTYQWLVEVPLAILPAWGLEWVNSLKGVKQQDLNNPFVGSPLPAYLTPATHTNSQQKQSLTKRASSSFGTEWSEREEARIRSALGAIPATGYDRWVQVGMALSSLDWNRPDGTSIAYDLFNDWSETAPDLYSLDATEKKWASFGRGRSGITLGSLFHLAESHGWAGLVPQEAPATPYMNGHGAGPNLLPAAFSPPDADSPLIFLNEKYSCIGDVGGKCMVMGWVPSKADPIVQIPSFQTFKSFAERFANRYVLVPKPTKDGGTEEKSEQLGAYWLKWKHRRSYEGIDMEPDAPEVLPNGCLNLWRGFAVEPAAGGWPLMQRHIAEVLADGDPAALDYIMKWSAWAVQNPGERAEAALVFRGSKGSGKGTFAHALRRMFGAHGLHVANSKHLVGAFNAHLRNCLLLYADEAFWAGDKQGESTLKALITEQTLTIEQKGVDAVQWHNRIHLIMTANAEWVVPASHDERRYAVFAVSEKYMGDEKYFESLHAEIANGGLEAMLHDLKQVKLGKWHPRQIIKTQALAEQKMQSMSPLHEWFESLLQDGVIPPAPKDAPDTAMIAYLLNHARDFAPKLRELNATRLGRFLGQHGCIKLHRANGNAWRFPELPKARELWAKNYQGWKWEHDAGQWATKV
jgi:hypothetical protein